MSGVASELRKVVSALPMRGWVIMAAAVAIGSLALALSLVFSAIAVLAVLVWALASWMGRVVARLLGAPVRTAPPTPRELEARRTAEGWVVEAV